MDIAEVGILATGLLVGYLCLFFVSKFKTYTVKQFVGVLVALFSGAAVTFIANNAGAVAPAAVFYYPIGLVVGALFWGVAKKTKLFPAGVLGLRD